MREGWTKEMVEDSRLRNKELDKIASKYDVIEIPPWLDDNDLREYLIEQHMVKYPEMSEEEIMKEVEETIISRKEIEEILETGNTLGKAIRTTKYHSQLALTDPEALKEDPRIQYKAYYKDKTDGWIEEEVTEEIESITQGALKNLKKIHQA